MKEENIYGDVPRVPDGFIGAPPKSDEPARIEDAKRLEGVAAAAAASDGIGWGTRVREEPPGPRYEGLGA